ncbi:MAG: imidazole glycerol phosphate synthase subunit HisF [Spirochaetales bacterium]|nr:imidazole glycerol phosphate synthase subunit HisF [Spirochaetales bacterium]
MAPVRVIACLDIKEGKAVKGAQFLNVITETRDPVEAAVTFCSQGADELVFRDITATVEQRATRLEWVKQVKDAITVPFTAGGGIHNMEDMAALFELGVDKIFINTAAVLHPELIRQAAKKYGKEKIIVAIDGKENPAGGAALEYEVVIKGGNQATGLGIVEWANVVEELGAGEIILTATNRDGTKQGYNLEMTKVVAEAVTIPVIAAGGAGKLEHFYDAAANGKAAALMAASVFHFKLHTPNEVKQYLKDKGVEVL